MKVFVAKQPVFDIDEKIVGYELLYRNDDSNNIFPDVNGDQATAEVLINTYLNIGLQRLTEGKQCSVHFTETLLKQGLPKLFSTDEMVVKIDRKVQPSLPLLEILQELKQLDYRITMHETAFKKNYSFMDDMLKYIDLIEVDFSHIVTDQEKIEKLAKRFGIELLADKIESIEQFEEAKSRGYRLFQGFYFSKPTIQSIYEIPAVFPSSLQQSEHEALSLDEDQLVQLIEGDLSFSIKLLRLLNSNAVEDHKVCSIREAISLIGIVELQEWIKLLTIVSLIKDQTPLPYEKNQFILTRAKLCEFISKHIGNNSPSCFYLFGMISTINKFKCEYMEEILEGLPIKEEMYDGLIGAENEFKLVLDLVQDVEQANWKGIQEKCKKLEITERELFRLYGEALNWTKSMIPTKKSESNVVIF